MKKTRALSRRFEKIELSEPTIAESVQILKGLRSRYEEHHGIVYMDTALKSACELSAKYLNDRFLPDKAIDVIDEAGAFIRLTGKGNRKKINPSDIEKIVAKMARVPTVSISTPDKAKLETLEDRLKGVVFGQDDAITALVTAIKRQRAGLGHPEKAGGIVPVQRAHRRGQNRGGPPGGHESGHRIHPFRYERVHGKACRGQAHRRTAWIYRF